MYLNQNHIVMKKLFVFIITVGLLLIAYFLTDGFTYLGGELSYSAQQILWALAIGVTIILIVYLLKDRVRRYVEGQEVTPFVDEP